ncbi:MAG TPA: thioredoxin family protein, partial [Chloroflexota bacterium]|nr:thioredoxin family protein [Chloroflexota bacterium]
KDRKTLEDLFSQRMKNDVTVTYFTQGESKLFIPGQECELCRETRQMLEEVTELSDHVHLEVKDFVRDGELAAEMGVTRIPAIVLQGKGKGQVRFFGIPSGYEFSTLIEDLFEVSSGQTTLSDKTRTALKDVNQPLHIQVFVTPT